MLNIFNSAYSRLPLAPLPKPSWVCKKARTGSNLIAPRTKESPASDRDGDGDRRYMDTRRKKAASESESEKSEDSAVLSYSSSTSLCLGRDAHNDSRSSA